MAQPIFEVKGIQETLALLNKIDPTYRRDVTKRIKRAGSVNPYRTDTFWVQTIPPNDYATARRSRGNL
jgi:hypothetical protein